MPIYSVSLRWNHEAKMVGAKLLGVVQNAIQRILIKTVGFKRNDC